MDQEDNIVNINLQDLPKLSQPLPTNQHNSAKRDIAMAKLREMQSLQEKGELRKLRTMATEVNFGDII
jgi:hypothetical protein